MRVSGYIPIKFRVGRFFFFFNFIENMMVRLTFHVRHHVIDVFDIILIKRINKGRLESSKG